jgi:hypothetical protein
MLFYCNLFSEIKRNYFKNPNPIMHYAIKSLGPIYKVLLKTLFNYEIILFTDLFCSFEF